MPYSPDSVPWLQRRIEQIVNGFRSSTGEFFPCRACRRGWTSADCRPRRGVAEGTDGHMMARGDLVFERLEHGRESWSAF